MEAALICHRNSQEPKMVEPGAKMATIWDMTAIWVPGVPAAGYDHIDVFPGSKMLPWHLRALLHGSGQQLTGITWRPPKVQ